MLLFEDMIFYSVRFLDDLGKFLLSTPIFFIVVLLLVYYSFRLFKRLVS